MQSGIQPRGFVVEKNSRRYGDVKRESLVHTDAEDVLHFTQWPNSLSISRLKRHGTGHGRLWDHDMKRTRIAIAALLLGSAPALAAQNSFVGEYSVSFLGLPIARATFNSSYDGDKYTINGNVAASGLAKLFDDTNGSLTARGTLGDKHPVPSSFHAGYTYGSKASSIDIRFKDGNVVSTKVVPKPRGHGDDWVKLGAENLVKVVDPIASTVLRARSIDCLLYTSPSPRDS